MRHVQAMVVGIHGLGTLDSHEPTTARFNVTVWRGMCIVVLGPVRDTSLLSSKTVGSSTVFLFRLRNVVSCVFSDINGVIDTPDCVRSN